MITLPSSIIARQEESVETIASLRASLAEANKKGHAADALLTASHLEVVLKAAFRFHLKHPEAKLLKKLFVWNGALGTFSAKIDLALAIGATSEETHRVLHVIREIRNEFAHPDDDVDFDSPVMDGFFKRLKAKGRSRESIYLRSAVDCVNDIQARMEPRTLGALGQHSARKK